MFPILLAAPGVFCAGCAVYLLILAAASVPRRREAPGPAAEAKDRLLVLVPAHNEEVLIARSVQSLIGQTYPRELFRVVVIADNCTDRTASAAVEAGAEVMVRTEPAAMGKGQALRWAMDRVLAAPDRPDAIVVVDADSIADPDLVAALAAEMRAGHDVVQADYSLLGVDGSPRSELLSAAFLLFHRVRFNGRARLAMAANLVGNGMLFRSSVLESHPWDAFTGVEDLEYSLRLRLAGVRPWFAPGAHVAGPGPASSPGALRQRVRWEGGRFYVVRRYLVKLVAAAATRRDFSLLDAAIDLATPPLGLLTLATVGGLVATIVAIAAGGVAPASVLIPWAVATVALPGFVVIGLWSAGEKDEIWRLAFAAPGFLMWKLGAYLGMLRGHDVRRWDRTDRVLS